MNFIRNFPKKHLLPDIEAKYLIWSFYNLIPLSLSDYGDSWLRAATCFLVGQQNGRGKLCPSTYPFACNKKIICIPIRKSSSNFPQGESGLKIPKVAIEWMSKPFQFSLFSKFSHGNPFMERSRSIFSKLGLKSAFSLDHLDPKHMQIRLQEEKDFKRIWLREVWILDGFPIRSFRWSPNFKLDAKSFVLPIWISLPNISLFLFNKQGLFSIGSLLGKPLTMDAATADLSHLTLPVCMWRSIL